jgi:CubicO group peptidase (beta-lactamase class C family)
MEKLQFRTLYREFLFRVVDLEILSQQGDIPKLLGRFAAILVFISLWQAVVVLMVAAAAGRSEFSLLLAWATEHALISTTMLAVGLFAVLSWDSAFPDRRDVLILSPLPVSARVLFFSKVAAVAFALAVTLLALNGLSGLVAPFVYATSPEAPPPKFDSALPPVGVEQMQAVLDSDLEESRRPDGPLAPGSKARLAIGVVKGDQERIITYGTAMPDSVFQIGSITKTFTALLLARMAVEGKVNLDTPVRELLPPGIVAKPGGEEIKLVDLATHHSSLPDLPDNLGSGQIPNIGAEYSNGDLYAYIAKRGAGKLHDAPFRYSNAGYALLGTALADRAGTNYADLLKQQVTAPLGLSDTTLLITLEQYQRIARAFNTRGGFLNPWEWRALAPAGTLFSTPGDMLIYLKAQLHPERYAALAPAILESHRIRAKANSGLEIALGWMFDPETGAYWHDGSISGYTSYAFFNPAADYAGLVLFNRRESFDFAGLLGRRIEQRFAGLPPVSLSRPILPASTSLFSVLRAFAAYWIATIGAAMFTFCAVLTVQGLAQLLPRQVFLRVSSALQMLFFLALLTIYFLQPSTAGPEAIVEDGAILSWLPSYWFFGLGVQLMGPAPPAVALLAKRAWIGWAVSFLGAAASYLICYFRTLRKIAEQPDILPSASRLRWAPTVGNPLETAITHFGVRTLLRSRQHRVILSFYLGIALGLMAFVSNAPVLRSQRSATNVWYLVNAPALVSTVIMVAAAVVGTRIVFSLPLALRANWIFRVMPLPGPAQCMAATRRALYIIGIVPVWIVFAILLFWLWPPKEAAEHLVILALIAGIIGELCLNGMYKLPFTCSYLPGKSYLNLIVMGVVGSMLAAAKGAAYERDALQSPPFYLAIVGGLAIVLALVRWRTTRNANSEIAALHFEERLEPAIQVLGLHHDGVVVIDGVS